MGLLKFWAVFSLTMLCSTAFRIRFLRSMLQSGVRRSFSESSQDELKYHNFAFQVKPVEYVSKARTGVISTPHGDVETPNFIFCATKAAMKGVTPAQLRECGTQFILSNTYHLMLSPGSTSISKLGGLQQATGWNGPMLTDSGGYQVFSMGHGSVSSEIKGNKQARGQQSLIKITEHGATFRSHIDGTIHELTPEKSMEVQRELGADIVLVFDECTPFHVDKAYTRASMERSHRWALRCLSDFARTHVHKQALYGIVQGGVYEDLRDISTNFCNNNNFFGVAIGGSLGKTKQDMHAIVSYTRARLRDDKPVHLLGIGGIVDIFHGVRQGIDTFDCVHPSRLARHGGALVKARNWSSDAKKIKEHITLKNAAMRANPDPIDRSCSCYTCRNFSRGYLHHLFQSGESLAGTLVTIHNVHFINTMMREIRAAIADGSLDALEREYVHPALRSA